MKYRLKNGDIVTIEPQTEREQVEDAKFMLQCLLNYHVRATKTNHISLSPPTDNKKWFEAWMSRKELSQDRYANALLLAIKFFDEFLSNNPEEEIRDLDIENVDSFSLMLRKKSRKPIRFAVSTQIQCQHCQQEPEQNI